MALVIAGQRRWRDVVAAAPDLHLRLAVLCDRLRLVQALQRTVVALVQAPAVLDGQPHAVHLVERDPQRADRALQHRGVRVIERDAGGRELAPGLARLFASLVGEIDVVPAGEQVGDVPLALAVTDENEFSGHAWLRGSG
jgi:hypothetical protein